MKTILPNALVCEVTLDGKRRKIRPTIWHVMRAMELLADESMFERDRIRLAVWHLYQWPRPKPTQEAVDAVFDLIMEESPYGKDPKSRQSMDQTQDAAMIVAAFRQLYSIDLPSEANRLDWRVYSALLGGVTDATAMGEIMHIRTMDIPKWTPHNGEDRRNIQRLKMIYAIRKPAKQTSFDAGLRSMVDILMSMCDEEEVDHGKSGNRSEPDRPDFSSEPDGSDC